MSEAGSKPPTSPSLPYHPRRRSIDPSHVLNGDYSLSKSTSRSSSTIVRPQEGDKLASSIRATYDRKTLVDLDPITANGYDRYSYEDNLGEQEDSLVNLKSESLEPRNGSLTSIPELPRDKGDTIRSQAATARPGESLLTTMPPIDFDGLSWPSIGTRARLEQTPEQAQARIDKLASAVRVILECIGEDPDRPGLANTPERYAKALMFFSKGYEENIREIVNGAVFQEDHDELIIVKDIEVHSLCEHHMVPFLGKIHIGYIPNQRVLGLSKLVSGQVHQKARRIYANTEEKARLAEMFSRRLQIQERLTRQIALTLAEVLQPQGVAVVMESTHLCMVMRGVQKSGSSTTTSCMLGCFRRSSKTRKEFLSLLKKQL